MRIARLQLRNFRVFHELDLELPPGVVGIYGPNGSGKSTVLDALMWSLFGVSRTPKDGVRSDNTNGDCWSIVTFEHDGHLYEVRRTLSGSNSVKAEALWNGEQVAAGVGDVKKYLHQILGLDAAAFRASVFCEQKQLDAFTGRRPEERKKLVLDLLGISPLDVARDTARQAAREARTSLETSRKLLVDLDALSEELGNLELELVTAHAHREAVSGTREGYEAAVEAAESVMKTHEATKSARDQLFVSYDAARQRAKAGDARVADDAQRLKEAREAEKELAEITPSLRELVPVRRRLQLLDAVHQAEMEVEGALSVVASVLDGRLPVNIEALRDLESAERSAAQGLREAGEQVAGSEAELMSVVRERETAEQLLADLGALDQGAPCPLCGQQLGAGFEEVERHRGLALRRSQHREAVIRAEVASARKDKARAASIAEAASTDLRIARAEWESGMAARTEVEVAEKRLAEAKALLGEPAAVGERDALRASVDRLEVAEKRGIRLRILAEQIGDLERRLNEEEVALEAAKSEAADLLARGTALGYDQTAHAVAATTLDQARRSLASAREAETIARDGESKLAGRIQERKSQIAAERERRARIEELEGEAQHLGRLAELLGEFRNTLIAQVGPALSEQTSTLFRELTDARFDRLDVDPETFELRVSTAGQSHSIARHSGSETDLANLSLRVAISEHVTLLSGGQVELLVLDEVLGSLDIEHRDRMLSALTRLGARFRQILVVTHAQEVKEQLPQAIEIVPLGQGRSTARLAVAPTL